MDYIGELDAVLDKEHWDVVADQVPIAFGGVELRGESAGIAGSVHGTAETCNGGEAHKDRSFLAFIEHLRAADFCALAVGDEGSVGAGTTGVHYALWDAFVIEVLQLIAQLLVLNQYRTALACAQGVICRGVARALAVGEVTALLVTWVRVTSPDVKWAAGCTAKFRAALIRIGCWWIHWSCGPSSSGVCPEGAGAMPVVSIFFSLSFDDGVVEPMSVDTLIVVSGDIAWYCIVELEQLEPHS